MLRPKSQDHSLVNRKDRVGWCNLVIRKAIKQEEAVSKERCMGSLAIIRLRRVQILQISMARNLNWEEPHQTIG